MQRKMLTRFESTWIEDVSSSILSILIWVRLTDEYALKALEPSCDIWENPWANLLVQPVHEWIYYNVDVTKGYENKIE